MKSTANRTRPESNKRWHGSASIECCRCGRAIRAELVMGAGVWNNAGNYDANVALGSEVLCTDALHPMKRTSKTSTLEHPLPSPPSNQVQGMLFGEYPLVQPKPCLAKPCLAKPCLAKQGRLLAAGLAPGLSTAATAVILRTPARGHRGASECAPDAKGPIKIGPTGKRIGPAP